MTSPRRIAVLGTGYVGLTVAAGLAFMRHGVVCADRDASKIEMLSVGDVRIFEEGLPQLIRDMMSAGRLSFTTSNVEAIAKAEFVFLCLPTPSGRDGHPDLSSTRTVAKEIGPYLQSGSIVINKSTVPVGTAHTVRDLINRSDVHVVSNPEFLSEGSAVLDFLQPDRIVIGADSPEIGYRLAEIYGNLTDRKCMVTDTSSAELIKYASNAYLATRLTFINTMAELCEAVGADIRAVASGMGADQRIGTAFLSPGPGWGGSCFPKDTEALIHVAEAYECDISLVKAAVVANATHMERIVKKVEDAVGGSLIDKVVAVWGLAFKAGTNDVRSSPALTIVASLQQRGARIRAYDPTMQESLAGIEVVKDKELACAGADILLVTTEWPEFASADLSAIGELMNQRSIVDARNVINVDDAHRAQFDYVGVGLGLINSTTTVVRAGMQLDESKLL